MARTYTTVGWEDGTVLQPAKVTVQGTEYNVENEVVTGRTPINAQNLRKMDNEIKRIVEEDIPSVYDEKLLTISDTAPSECIEGDKYYNTTDNKIYTAVATDTWSQDGDTPIEGKLYVVFNEQSTYAYNGTTLVSVGGGSGSSDIVVVPTETPTEETKLEIEDEDFDFDGSEITDEYSESTEVGYSANYSNGHFQGKFEKGRIPVSSMSAFSIGSDNLMHKEITFTKQYTNTPMVLTNLTTSRPRSYYGFLGTYTRSNNNTGCDICANANIIADEYAWVDYIVISMD